MYLQNVSIALCPFPISLNDKTVRILTSCGTFPQSIVLLIKLLVETLGPWTRNSLYQRIYIVPFYLVVCNFN